MTAMHKRRCFESRQAVERYFQGSVIDEQGREIPITREMIERACYKIDQQLHQVETERRQRFS